MKIKKGWRSREEGREQEGKKRREVRKEGWR